MLNATCLAASLSLSSTKWMGFRRLVPLQCGRGFRSSVQVLEGFDLAIQGLAVLYLQRLFSYEKPAYDVRPGPFSYAVGETHNNFMSKNRTIPSCSACLFSHRPRPRNPGSGRHVRMMVGSIPCLTFRVLCIPCQHVVSPAGRTLLYHTSPGNVPCDTGGQCLARRVQGLYQRFLGEILNDGFDNPCQPVGTSRVNEMARHSRHTPPSRSWNLQ